MIPISTTRCRGCAAIALLWASVHAASAAGLPAEPPVASPVAHATATSTPFDRCEDAVAQSIRQMRGAAVEGLRFEPGSRSEDAQGTQVAIRGAGRYLRGGHTPVAFRYSCAYDAETGKTSGVLFHESDTTPPPALPVWHADVARLALDACEGEAAA